MTNFVGMKHGKECKDCWYIRNDKRCGKCRNHGSPQWKAALNAYYRAYFENEKKDGKIGLQD